MFIYQNDSEPFWIICIFFFKLVADRTFLTVTSDVIEYGETMIQSMPGETGANDSTVITVKKSLMSIQKTASDWKVTMTNYSPAWEICPGPRQRNVIRLK